MKIGICNWCMPYDNVQDLFEKLKKYNLLGVEVGVNSNYKQESVVNKNVQKEYIHFSKEMNIKIPTLGMNCFCEIGQSKKENRSWVRDAIKYSIEAAIEMNCKTIQIPSFGNGLIETEDDFLETAEFFAYSCDMIPRDAEIYISTENLLDSSQNKRMLKMVNSDKFKIYFDTQNPCSIGLDATKIANDLYENICEVHIKDNLNGESISLGLGDSNFDETVNVLFNKGYNGWLLLENNYFNNMEDINKDVAYMLKKL